MDRGEECVGITVVIMERDWHDGFEMCSGLKCSTYLVLWM